MAHNVLTGAQLSQDSHTTKWSAIVVRSAIGCRRLLRAGETRRRDLSWRSVGGAIVAPSRQVSPVRQADDGSHQTDGTYRLEADPFLSRRLLSDLSDHGRGRGPLGVGATRRLHQRPAAVPPRFGGAFNERGQPFGRMGIAGRLLQCNA